MDTDGDAEASVDMMDAISPGWCCGALWIYKYLGAEECMNKVLIPSWLDGVSVIFGMVPQRSKCSNDA
eukprot:10634279-Ditylum_brightwellii.AAC.1